eukprot:MONOS_12303.1-p1 / transcript=MONOS_12303.1 / gene=MONOS_12303 / organism=Monocercomonoides_exilis_PA203 / gene_product=unspecified product / transcript_product=unspecified product / location=Mono_scaffold00673:34-3056(-) / protein_length=978 / sequence_SO=supercontig / SO=protein_coding / is_pseudo=false
MVIVGCVCKSATSGGAGFVEESAKEGELGYSEGTWREKAQNNKIGDGHLFDTHIEGKEGGARESSKEERMMKKYTKQWNGRSGKVGKAEKWGFCEEWKMWGKEGMCGGSGVEGSVVGVNSSLKLNSLGLREMGGESVLRASDGSSVDVSGCVIGVERETPPFDLCGSCGLFTNISLRSSSTSTSTSTEQIFPPLFSSKAVEGEIPEKCHISVCSSHFSSFCVSSAPFISSHFVSLSQLEFFNISTNPLKTRQLAEGLGQRVFLMSGCTFSSVWDVYDGGIVPSLNSPSSSLAASNTSFVRCYRTQNVAISGSEGNPSKPARQQITDDGTNSFTWCVWNGSKTTGTGTSYSDGTSNGGAIYMYNKASGTLSVKFCSFNDCYAYCAGGVKIENNSFNSCTTKEQDGGGIFIRISGCEFQKCSAKYNGGGLYLYNFNVSGSSCIGTENGKGESACVFECLFTSCSLTNSYGGGMNCYGVPAAFKMRSLQFISCSAVSYGGGMRFYPYQSTPPSNNIYCYFFFFHDCSCNASTPYGHDVYFEDRYNLFSSYNPFYESYTTNSNEKRVYYQYYNGNNWVYQHTEKKDWLKDKTIYVSVNGNDLYEQCGSNESNPCLTVKRAFEVCEIQISLTITLLEGDHKREATTIAIETKKISVIGAGKEKSSIGTGALSSTRELFSVSTGHLGMSHLKVDCNSNANPSSPSVAVVSDGSGSLSLEDVVITTSKTGGYVMSSSVFVVALSQLSMVGVEIKDMNVSKPLFSEPDLSSPSSSLSSSSSTLYLTAITSGESVLANLTIRNVNRTGGDGVVMAKSVKGGETFVVWNTTTKGCECLNGDGGGLKVVLEEASSKILVGDSTSQSGGTTTFKQCKCNECGGGIFLSLMDANAMFELSGNLIFDGNEAEFGKNMFILASDLNKTVTNDSFNFDYSSMKDDNNLFVGSDDFHSNKDLFMFLIPYSSFEIFISSEGFDVARCGSEEEPCFT